MSRFGGGGKRLEKKRVVIEKLQTFFERSYGIGGQSFEADGDENQETEVDEFTTYNHNPVRYDSANTDDSLQLVEEKSEFIYEMTNEGHMSTETIIFIVTIATFILELVNAYKRKSKIIRYCFLQNKNDYLLVFWNASKEVIKETVTVYS